MNQDIKYVQCESYKKIAARERRVEKVTLQTYFQLHNFF